MRVLCYGVRPVEKPFFEASNKHFGFDLVMVEPLLNDETVHLAKGCQAVLLRGGCPADAKNLKIYKDYGVSYVLTRTVGYNHIDLEAAKKLGLKVAYVPFYSPNAIAELALTFAMTLSRHVQYMGDRSKDGNFVIDSCMFSKEVRKSTVGIIGLGKIGYTAATLFSGIGARVLGYDVIDKDYDETVLQSVDLDTLLRESDIISLHMPYIKGSNDGFINEKTISKMKDGVIIVNTSRGELQNIDDVLSCVESGKIHGFATDVLENETQYFNRIVQNDALLQRAQALYPRVLITPHIGSYTDEAVRNMVDVSFENLKAFIENGLSNNQLV